MYSNMSISSTENLSPPTRLFTKTFHEIEDFLRPSFMRVYSFLLRQIDFYEDVGDRLVSLSYIHNGTGLSKRTIIRALFHLEFVAGLIRRDVSRGRKSIISISRHLYYFDCKPIITDSRGTVMLDEIGFSPEAKPVDNCVITSHGGKNESENRCQNATGDLQTGAKMLHKLREDFQEKKECFFIKENKRAAKRRTVGELKIDQREEWQKEFLEDIAVCDYFSELMATGYHETPKSLVKLWFGHKNNQNRLLSTMGLESLKKFIQFRLEKGINPVTERKSYTKSYNQVTSTVKDYDPNPKKDWSATLRMLQQDYDHWQRLTSIPQTDQTIIRTNEKIMAQCKERLENHMSQTTNRIPCDNTH